MGFTSQQELRSYRDWTSISSLIRKTGEAGVQTRDNASSLTTVPCGLLQTFCTLGPPLHMTYFLYRLYNIELGVGHVRNI